MIPAVKFSTIALALLASMLGTAAVVTYNAEAVHVSVVERSRAGTHLHLIVPGMLVRMGVGFIPARHLSSHAAQAREWLPALKAASKELEHCPDAILVEVKSPDENVNISKRGDSLFVDVDSAAESVHISFPLSVVSTVVQKLEESNEADPPA